MSTIKLPPLPAPLRARIFDGMASVYSPDQLRARDLEVARVALEAAAVTAWTHYMDTCKKRGIAPADCEHWLAATPIRALEFKHHE